MLVRGRATRPSAARSDARDGNLRTQAATAINRRATSIHHGP
jgi:hypothetical protein